MTCIDLIARALIIKDNKILLAHKISEINTFLPGGHIELGEYAAEALRREISEELGLDVEVGKFVGIVEHKYTDKTCKYYEEVNIIFEVHLSTSKIDSNESELEFVWVDVCDLEEYVLYPSALQVAVKEWIDKRTPFHSTN